jgi:hypothetical protein
MKFSIEMIRIVAKSIYIYSYISSPVVEIGLGIRVGPATICEAQLYGNFLHFSSLAISVGTLN